MEGRWRRQNLEPALVRTGTILWQLASDGVGRRWPVAIFLSLRQSLDSSDGYGWVYSVAASYEFGAFFCSSQSWRANDRHSCLSLLALVGWPWVNAMLRMALLALLVAGFVKG